MVLCGTDLAGVRAMTIHRLFVNSPLGPEEISIVVAAYEQALSTLGLVDRDDPLTQLITKKTIQIWQTGIKDSTTICEQVIKVLGIP